MTDNFKPNTRKSDIVVQQLEDEILVYDLKTNKAYCLNETSAIVWRLCDGKRTVSDISDEMSKRLKTLVSKDFVLLALDQFNKDTLLESGWDRNDHFDGLSRREVIRKVGFASVIAFPMISSLVAPEASMAQSVMGFAPLALCSATPGVCASGQCNSTFVGFVNPGNQGFTSTGTTQCCNGGPGNTLTPASIFCSASSCASITNTCCAGTATPSAVVRSFCQNGGNNTCSCS